MDDSPADSLENTEPDPPGAGVPAGADADPAAEAALGADPDQPVAPGAGRRRWLPVVAGGTVVAVVLILLLAGILLPGFHPLTKTGGGSSAAALSFESAYALANSSAQSQTQGPWGLVVAYGYGAQTSTALSNATGSGPCGLGSVPTVAAESASQLVSGRLTLWVFGYTDSSQNELTVTVAGGVASGGTFAPASAHCLGTTAGSRPIAQLPHPDALMDSTAVAADFAAQLNWSLTFGTRGGVFFALTDEGSEVGTQTGTAFWLVGGSGCSFFTGPSAAPGDPSFEGAYNATNEKPVLDLQRPGVGFCETSGLLNMDLALGSPGETPVNLTVWNFTYSLSAVASGVTTSWFHPILYNTSGSGAIALGSTTAWITNQLGQVIAEYSFSAASWTVGAGVALATTDTLTIEGPLALAAQGLVLAANPPATGDIDVSLG